jgi:pyruvate dehydrogenase E1 component
MTPDLSADIIKGAYWQVEPQEGAELAIVYTGAVADEALKACEMLVEDVPGLGILAVPSADQVHRDWQQLGANSHISKLLQRLAPNAVLVTVIDGAPASLSWLGSVLGQKLAALGVTRFGQSADIPDIYQVHQLDAEAIIDTTAKVLLSQA